MAMRSRPISGKSFRLKVSKRKVPHQTARQTSNIHSTDSNAASNSRKMPLWECRTYPKRQMETIANSKATMAVLVNIWECADTSALWNDATCRVVENGDVSPQSKTLALCEGRFSAQANISKCKVVCHFTAVLVHGMACCRASDWLAVQFALILQPPAPISAFTSSFRILPSAFPRCRQSQNNVA